MSAEASEVLKHHDHLAQMRYPHEDDWRAIDWYVHRRDSYASDSSSWTGRTSDAGNVAGGLYGSGSRRARGLRADNTAPRAMTHLVNGLDSFLFGTDSFEVRHSDEGANESPGVAAALAELTKRLNAVVNNERFMWVPARRMALRNIASFGHGGVVTAINTASKSIEFQPVPVWQTWIAQNARGRVDVMSRMHALTAQQAFEAYGDRCHHEVRRQAEKNPYLRFTFVTTIRPVRGGVYERVTVDVSHSMVCDRRRLRRLRAHIGRWELLDNTPYGWGPVHDVLDEIKGANVERVTNLKAAHQAVEPTLVLQSGSYHRQYVERAPNLVISPPASETGELRFERLPGSDGLPIAVEMLQQTQQGIREGLFSHLLNIPNSPAMTATEYLGRLQEIVRAIGPAASRIAAEVAQPVGASVFEMLWRDDDVFGDVLAALPGVSVEDLVVEFVSPLDTARRAGEAEAILRLTAFVGSVAGMDPLAARKLMTDQAIHEYAERVGAPMDILLDRDAMEELRATAEQTQQISQVAQLAGQSADAATRVAELGATIA